ncbi:MAG: hypothetical protein ACO1Q7_17760 [Gemmatimonas sp.]
MFAAVVSRRAVGAAAFAAFVFAAFDFAVSVFAALVFAALDFAPADFPLSDFDAFGFAFDTLAFDELLRLFEDAVLRRETTWLLALPDVLSSSSASARGITAISRSTVRSAFGAWARTAAGTSVTMATTVRRAGNIRGRIRTIVLQQR